MATKIASSERKSIVFIDDKQKAEDFKKKLITQGNLDSKEVFIMNADVLEIQITNQVIRTLAVAHRVIPKVLITTAVLDNGVSIHDPEVGNVIITIMTVSFVTICSSCLCGIAIRGVHGSSSK